LLDSLLQETSGLLWTAELHLEDGMARLE